MVELALNTEEILRRIRDVEGEVWALRNRVTILEKRLDGNFVTEGKN